MGTIGIRRAMPEEAGALTDLALRSKASWGYAPEFMARCVDVLTITGDEIHQFPVFVVTDDDQVAGYYALAFDVPEAILLALFVEPDRVRQGLGLRLWAHAVATAKAIGCDRMTIESDPNAVPFYEAMGAHQTGEVESDVEPGRMLPVMRYQLR